ncbi:MAG: threonine ammonia-lyase [Candidatus Dormibacteraceae bacterium]
MKQKEQISGGATSLLIPTDRLDATVIEQAADALSSYLDPTPLQPSVAFTSQTGANVWFKFEGIQPTRCFKVRGALNKLLSLTPEERAAGVITASAGNHGQGVAYAARIFGVTATVYVPENANRLKVEVIRRIGSEVIHHGTNYQEAYLEAMRVQSQRGATFVHAFDDPQVIAGQGTVATELLSQLPNFDTVLVPVGGGGLIAGISTYLKERRAQTRVIGVEPRGAAGLAQSLQAGRILSLERVQTIADGLAASAPGVLPFELAGRYVDEVIQVEEEELLQTIRALFEWEHLLTEPAGAAAATALLHHYHPFADERVVVILSGSNVTNEVLIKALG